jgi:alanine dehydrogenase
MRIGLPKEIKDLEFRVGLTPAIVRMLAGRGHEVFVETQAGKGSGYEDGDYSSAGAKIVATAAEAWSQDLVVKVKEPLPTEYSYLREDLLLFTYLHLAAAKDLTIALQKSGTTAIAYECVETNDRHFPLLAPMSVIAGRLSVQFGARFLERQFGGSGILLGGIPGVKPGRVAILGGGVVGTEAARMAVGMGAIVQIIDLNIDRLNYLESLFGARVEYLYSNPEHIEESVRNADLVIGAVLVPGKRPPILVGRSLVGKMRPGSVIVDVAVDQGGCVETLRPTSHSHPTYIEEGVIHYGVPNMPGAVPRTSTQGLTNSTSPYILQLADHGLAALDNPSLAKGLNVRKGEIVHPAVKESFLDF